MEIQRNFGKFAIVYSHKICKNNHNLSKARQIYQEFRIILHKHEQFNIIIKFLLILAIRK